MSLYYEDESIRLYHGDCLEIDAWLEADVLCTDPPYGIDYNSGHFGTLPRSIDGDQDCRARDMVLAKWVVEHGAKAPAVMFGSWRMPKPIGIRALLVWDTKGALGMGALDLPWKPAHQEIYVIGHGFHGHRGTDVLSVAPVQSMAKNGRTHPNEKPVDLMKALISKCPPGVVADPFAGSGSTLVAAKQLGRKAIGVELEERYAEICAKRLSQGVLPLGGVI